MIRGLSLMQPWTSLVALGHKRFETRSWTTNCRGWLALHASKGYPVWAQEMTDLPEFTAVLPNAPMVTGAIIAVVRLTDVISTNDITRDDTIAAPAQRAGTWFFPSTELLFGDYSPNRFAWRLEDVVQVEPIPCRGALGLWPLPPDIESRVLAETGISVTAPSPHLF